LNRIKSRETSLTENARLLQKKLLHFGRTNGYNFGMRRQRRASAKPSQLLEKPLPDPILAPVVLGPSALIASSAPLQWPSLLLEKHSCPPGERTEGKSLDRPVLVMLCSQFWRGEHKKGGALMEVRKTLGALTVVPKGPVPMMRSLQKSDILYCAFDVSFLAAVRNELDGRMPLPLESRPGLHDQATAQILNLLFAEVEFGGSSGALYAESLAHALAARFLFLGNRPHSPGRKATLSHRRLSQIQEFIESHLDTDLTLLELAAQSGYSRSHFLRAFHTATGLTPHLYVLKRRTESARQLLEQTDLGIVEIAYRCGFANQAHLTLTFRKEFGVTPGEYRRQL
jgi:AraC family transcriptional regulator